jgi:AcrR family transcriptional regulator
MKFPEAAAPAGRPQTSVFQSTSWTMIPFGSRTWKARTDLADRDGLEAVTMRRVAASLGVGAMTLYTYVPGKAELLDLMLDSAYARMSRADTTGQPWRRRLITIAEENRALFDAYP